MKLLLLSDVHFCQQDFYGISYDKRKADFVKNLNAAYEKDPYEAILFLGDYSLDFWAWNAGGSYVHDKVSYTARFVDEILPQLSCKTHYLIPGNHEQYAPADWERITGCKRQFSLATDKALILMLDTFAGDLDPDYDSDGTYTGADMAFIKAQMEKHPELPVILCAHYFDEKRESAAFTALVKEDKRIVCLFCGHDHVLSCTPMSADCGGKLLFHTGNYSYAGRHLANCPFGWRELEITADAVKTTYVAAAMEVEEGGVTVSCEAMRYPTVKIPFLK